MDMPRICTVLGLPQLMVSSLFHAILATAAMPVLMLLGSEAQVSSHILLFSCSSLGVVAHPLSSRRPEL